MQNEIRLSEFFKDFSPVFGDNMIEDQTEMLKTIMENRASLIIYAKAGSSQFDNFILPEYKKKQRGKYFLPKPQFAKCGNQEYIYDTIEVNNNTNASKFLRLCRRAISCPTSVYDSTIRVYNNDIDSFLDSPFKLFKDISRGNTPEKVCHFFKCSKSPFKCLPYLDNQVAFEKHLDYQDIILLYEDVINPLCKRSRIRISLPTTKVYPCGLCPVIDFYDIDNSSVMKVMVTYNFEDSKKVYIPVTNWCSMCNYADAFVCVPNKHAILFNLNLLDVPETTNVLLTPDLVFAAANKLPKPWVCSSWFCDDLKLVDWKPLEGKNITLLVHPYNGLNFEQSVIKLSELATYLKDNVGLQLQFLVIDVKYGDYSYKNVKNISDLACLHQHNRPNIVEGSVQFMDWMQFEELVEKARPRLNQKAIWETCVEVDEAKIDEKKSSAFDYEYLIYPIAAKGEYTIIKATKGIGKSNLAYSLGAIAANNSQRVEPIFKEQLWKATNNGCNVLLIDFENSPNTRQEKFKNFSLPYLPKDKDRLDQCKENFVIKNLNENDRIDYSLPENHQAFIDFVTNAKKSDGSPLNVDLLIIDPIGKFIKADTPSSAIALSELIDKLRKLNIAIVIFSHTATDGSIAGAKSKLRDAFIVVNVAREKNANATLATPITISMSNMRPNLPQVAINSFDVKFTDSKWQVVNPAQTEDEAYFEHIKHYHVNGYTRAQISKVLGITKERHADIKKIYKK